MACKQQAIFILFERICWFNFFLAGLQDMASTIDPEMVLVWREENIVQVD